MALILFLTTSILIAFTIFWIAPIFNRYQQARKIGLPVLFTPIDILNPIFQLYGEFITKIFNRLPFGLGLFVNYSSFSSFLKNRYELLHAKYGPAFTVITPKELVVHICDPAAAESILSRRKDFIKPPQMYQPLDLFGKNVDTVNGEEWQRHRKLTTPPFNERNSRHVWAESLRQASGMLESWTRKKDEGVVAIHSTLTLALHVLTSAGLGKSFDFEGGVTKLSGGHTLSYQDALKIVLNNVFYTIIITSIDLPLKWLPKKFRRVKIAINEFQAHMEEMVEAEKLVMDRSDAEKDNLLSVLVRASETTETGGRKAMTKEEIFGNLFIYNLAGHDTTANTLAYALTLMSTDIKWQEWIREELNEVFRDEDEIENWDYESAFPRLKRCMAIMNETLRLYGPIIVIPKSTPEHSSSVVDIQEKPYTMPPNTIVPVNVSALHTDPKTWGTDVLSWRPDRWISDPIPISSSSASELSSPPSSASTPAPSTNSLPISSPPKPKNEEELLQPPSGSFIPWASGPRVCPGKKFSQVEFVAVIARLFKRHSVRVKLDPGESEEEARRRVWDCVEDSTLTVTVEMRRPERVRLVWEEVGG